MGIDVRTSDIELAALVSQALEEAGIAATLVGGAAVSIHSENECKSMDLDFATAATRQRLTVALEPLGFQLAQDKRHFVHPGTQYYVEFPPSPFGIWEPNSAPHGYSVVGNRVGTIESYHTDTLRHGSPSCLLALE